MRVHTISFKLWPADHTGPVELITIQRKLSSCTSFVMPSSIDDITSQESVLRAFGSFNTISRTPSFCLIIVLCFRKLPARIKAGAAVAAKLELYNIVKKKEKQL